jgi:hypothetical protein
VWKVRETKKESMRYCADDSKTNDRNIYPLQGLPLSIMVNDLSGLLTVA